MSATSRAALSVGGKLDAPKSWGKSQISRIALANTTVWPSGLRRWLQAPVRKGVGSNPTAVIFTLLLKQKLIGAGCKQNLARLLRISEQAEMRKNESGVAQWLACWAHNPKVRGSKPRSAIFSSPCWSVQRERASRKRALLTNTIWTHWGLSPGPSACEADVIPLHHVPHESSGKTSASHCKHIFEVRVERQRQRCSWANDERTST